MLRHKHRWIGGEKEEAEACVPKRGEDGGEKLDRGERGRKESPAGLVFGLYSYLLYYREALGGSMQHLEAMRLYSLGPGVYGNMKRLNSAARVPAKIPRVGSNVPGYQIGGGDLYRIAPGSLARYWSSGARLGLDINLLSPRQSRKSQYRQRNPPFRSPCTVAVLRTRDL